MKLQVHLLLTRACHAIQPLGTFHFHIMHVGAARLYLHVVSTTCVHNQGKMLHCMHHDVLTLVCTILSLVPAPCPKHAILVWCIVYCADRLACMSAVFCNRWSQCCSEVDCLLCRQHIPLQCFVACNDGFKQALPGRELQTMCLCCTSRIGNYLA